MEIDVSSSVFDVKMTSLARLRGEAIYLTAVVDNRRESTHYDSYTLLRHFKGDQHVMTVANSGRPARKSVRNTTFYGKQIIIRKNRFIENDPDTVTHSRIFEAFVSKYLDTLRKSRSPFLELLPDDLPKRDQNRLMISLLRNLSEKSSGQLISESDKFTSLLNMGDLLHRFVGSLYDYWRSYERFLVYYSNEKDILASKKPNRAFNATAELLNALVRQVYRDVCENITGASRKIYRQIAAGCQVALIVKQEDLDYPEPYKQFRSVNVIKQVLIEPPLIIDPPMNKREGAFVRADKNPVSGIRIREDEWLCYPAKVGDLTIHVLFHNTFIGLGTAMSNLFELDDVRRPDAIYAFGVKQNQVDRAVFFEDKKHDLLVAAAPGNNDYGYFGYLKKMVLTLHNIICMKRGRLPVHGAMVRITLRSGEAGNFVLIGDSGAGKSEAIEAFRLLAGRHLSDFTIVFDDMGSLEITRSGIRAYGTEIGAFVRLDDLNPGYAFGSIDRSIIMSPQRTNARAILPITSPAEITKGHKIDYFLYANNYEDIDGDHPLLERFRSKGDALKTFREGARMAKGTTAEKGLVHSFYANIFGPSQYRDLYEKLAKRYFARLFSEGVFVGQLRTRLGIEGYETKGPEAAARTLLKALSEQPPS